MGGKERRSTPQVSAPATAPPVTAPAGVGNADVQAEMEAARPFSSAALERSNSFVFTPEQLASLMEIVEKTRETGREHSVQVMRDVSDPHAPYRFPDESVVEGHAGVIRSEGREDATADFGGLNEECAGLAHTHPDQGPGASILGRHEVMASPTDVRSMEAEFEGPVPSFDGAPDFLQMMLGSAKNGTPDVLIIASVGAIPLGERLPMKPRPRNVDALARRVAKHNPALSVWYGALDGPIERVGP